MPDGSVYAGVSPDTGRQMYVTPGDAVIAHSPVTCIFSDEAADYASKLDVHGHRDWRVPTKGELNVLFQHRAAIGGFNTTGTPLDGWYWSSLRDETGHVALQRFSDGTQWSVDTVLLASLRCVRG